MDLYSFQKSAKYPNPRQFRLLEYCNVLTSSDLQYVYTPGDDSYLMLSVLNQQIENNQINAPQVILEIGSGSGILLAHLYDWLRSKGKQPTLAFTTDINYQACMVSTRYYQAYSLAIQSICTSMMDHLRLSPDIIVFNPPYIPSDLEEQEKEKARLDLKMQQLKKGVVQRTYDNNMIAYSWMGGEDGLKTVWELIEVIDWKCTIYLVAIHENPIGKLKQVTEAKGFEFQVLGFKHKYNQKIFIIKLKKH